MKNIFKATTLIALASTVALSSCIEEVYPTSDVSQEQLESSVKAGEAMIMAMPGFMVNWNSTGAEWHGDFGYSSMMHIRDCMTGDMSILGIGLNYNQWSNYTQIVYLGQNYASVQRIWVYLNKQVLACNKALEYYNEDVEDEYSKGARATALTFRALTYLDLARWYEFLPNNNTSATNSFGNNVEGLTVPIVTETTTEQEARNNPRATHEEMSAFLLKDLDYAEQNIGYASYGTMLLPDLACVYGLKARLYMWNNDYAKAAEYAKLAIDASGCTPLTKEAWTSPTSGFNSFDNTSWMWGLKFEKENDAVATGICNWTSMMSPEAEYGYAAVGACPIIDASMYARISDTDFRKLSWVTPGVTALSTEFPLCVEDDRAFYVQNFPYASIKFRPGAGNVSDANEGSATAVPVMRVEEMWFNYIESVAHTNPAEGKKLLTDFMVNYRDPQYTCEATDQDAIIEEIVFQKRVELWGEGHTLYDIKRLNYSVTRNYEGTNFYAGSEKNTIGRPAWMNMVIVQSEGNNNAAVAKWNNPDIPDTY
ncbi:MAG: RagB/SusD family nutrient uptake outer membrane protein [Bacteroides sp.]|nr:RagB/SusD family nutrient uptake outer membrane protein [Bacteroides sp.]MBD5353725.1 RagB/SusD family nutrient uptake outer membrane protein [Bacteroides sp.]